MKRSTNSKKYDEHYLYIEDKYGHLADGVSCAGELCPRCKGGQSEEKSFSVNRQRGTLFFRCWRASCGFRGAITTRGGGALPQPATESKRVDGRSRYDSLGKGTIPDFNKAQLRVRYQLTEDLLGKGHFRWTQQHSQNGAGRLVMPVLDKAGYPYGYVARKLDDQPGPKTLSMFENNQGCWYNCKGSKELLIVEDQISALRASQYINSVALMGVNVTDETIKSIKSGGYTGIFLALDPDAFPLSIKLAHILKPHFKVRVIRLDRDLKDMDEDGIVDALHGAGVSFQGVVI